MDKKDNKREIKFVIFLGMVFFVVPIIMQWNLIANGYLNVKEDGVTGVISRAYIGRSLIENDFPFWTPYLAGGMPYAGIIANAFYPIAWICGLLPFSITGYVYLSVHYCIGGIYMYLYIKKIGCHRIVAVASSFVFLFTPHMGGGRREHISLIISALYMAAVFYYLECYIQEVKLRYLFFASIVMALQFYAGFLQYIVYMDIVAGIYLIIGAIHRNLPFSNVIKSIILWVTTYFLMLSASIFPLAQLLSFVGNRGGEGTSYDYFIGYSLHPMKLLVILFPYIFGNNIRAALLDKNFSSGLDVELSYGVIVVIMVLYALFVVRGSRHYKFFMITAIMTFVYSCMGNIPMLGHLLYKVPIINNFRVPSRALFIVTFSVIVLFALALESIYQDGCAKKEMSVVLLMVLLILVGVGIFYYSDGWNVCEQGKFQIVFFRTYKYYSIFFLAFVMYLLFNKKNIRNNISGGMLIFVSAFLTTAWMYPFYIESGYSSLLEESAIGDVMDEGEYKSISTDVGNDLLKSMYWSNRQLIDKQPTLNSYSNFNLPYLYSYLNHTNSVPVNRSGMYLIFGDTIYTNQDFLSMMSVKYIVVPDDIENRKVVENNKSITVLNESELLNVDNVEMEDRSDYSIWAKLVDVEDNTNYCVDIVIDGDTEGSFYVDLYDAATGDEDRVKTFNVIDCGDEQQKFSAVLSTESISEDSQLYLRLVSTLNKKDVVDSISFSKLITDSKPAYTQVYRDSRFCVYENEKANEIIYPCKMVKRIDSDEVERLYVNSDQFDIDSIDYIEDIDYDYDFSSADVQVSNINMNNNIVTAQVHANDDTFINMSQSYYPGWKGFVDGEETKVYMVNGIIQGIFVPAGEHSIEFRYVPFTLLCGVIISVVSFLIILVYIVLDYRNFLSSYKKEV